MTTAPMRVRLLHFNLNWAKACYGEGIRSNLVAGTCFCIEPKCATAQPQIIPWKRERYVKPRSKQGLVEFHLIRVAIRKYCRKRQEKAKVRTHFLVARSNSGKAREYRWAHRNKWHQNWLMSVALILISEASTGTQIRKSNQRLSLQRAYFFI